MKKASHGSRYTTAVTGSRSILLSKVVLGSWYYDAHQFRTNLILNYMIFYGIT